MRCSDTRRSIAHAGDVCTHRKRERLGVGGRCSGWRRGIRGWEAERRGGGRATKGCMRDWRATPRIL